MRGANRVLAPLLALALLVLGSLVVVEVVHALTVGGAPVLLAYDSLAAWARDHAWEDRLVLGISIAVASIGLVLLLAELKPHRPGLMLLAEKAERTRVGLPRRSLATAVAEAATSVDGVSSASTRVRRRSVTVSAVSHLRDVSGLSETLEERLQSFVDALELAAPMTAKVRLTQQER